jgi:hypothetical protein
MQVRFVSLTREAPMSPAIRQRALEIMRQDSSYTMLEATDKAIAEKLSGSDEPVASKRDMRYWKREEFGN